LDGCNRDGVDCLTDEYDQNEETTMMYSSDARKPLVEAGDEQENCDDDYGDEDEMIR
jgi:hypothetical protein